MEEIQGRFSSLLVAVRQAMESGNISALDLWQFLVGFFQSDDFLTDSPDNIIVKMFDRVSLSQDSGITNTRVHSRKLFDIFYQIVSWSEML